MNNGRLSEKEFEIVNIIADGYRSSQRAISGQVGLSLGMTNLLLKRLVTKGYLRIRQLNRKKMEYLLTPRGLTEKAHKTYNYTLKTIQSLGLIRLEIRRIVLHSIDSTTKRLVVTGHGDLADLTHLALQELAVERNLPLDRADAVPPAGLAQALIIDASDSAERSDGHRDRISLLAQLAQGRRSRASADAPSRESGHREKL